MAEACRWAITGDLEKGEAPVGYGPDRASDVTVLLRAWDDGDLYHAEELLPPVYRDVDVPAVGCPRHERPDH